MADPQAKRPTMRGDAIVEVEEALGPGIDFEGDEHLGLVGVRARSGDAWQGYDRAALIESDDGQGSRLAVLVWTPASTFAGCLLRVRLLGGWRDGDVVVLAASLPGLSGFAAGDAAAVADLSPAAAWFGPDEARREAGSARRRARERRSRGRILGGKAWRTSAGGRLEDRRFSTPHSLAEYDVRRLPLRFQRGLDGLLDDDERLLYSIERPWSPDAGVISRLRGDDRRAALLALTDRQLIWAVDHLQPDRFLSDQGIDTEFLPVERISRVRVRQGARTEVRLEVRSGAQERTFVLPGELAEEARVMAALVTRFTDGADGLVPRRVYELMAAAWDDEWAARFGQSELAERLFSVAGVSEPLARIYSPRRAGQRRARAAVLTTEAVVLVDEDGSERIALGSVGMLESTISPLTGRFAVRVAGAPHGVTYPAPLRSMGTIFARLARRALANLVC